MLSTMALRITPFAPALGAEVRGVDLADGLDEQTYRHVRAALLQFGVLFFKDQREIGPATTWPSAGCSAICTCIRRRRRCPAFPRSS
jgi:alpha-ketoglutarate-dependent taurine dioxygenase